MNDDLKFKEYSEVAFSTAFYPKKGKNMLYPVLGLCGEAGEVAEKIKKRIRDHNGDFSDPIFKQELVKELGDVLWYLSAVAMELDVPLDQIAQANLDKLLSRKKRGVLHGEGDNR